MAGPHDERYMRRALSLARAGTGATYPNPCVGAVVVQRGTVVGAARSAAAGGAHAEVRALARAGTKARGATLYVTLEPCAHHGKTPPCIEAIAEHDIARVVYGVADPAAHASGRGPRRLRRSGVGVVRGVLEQQCRAVHEHYLHHVATGRPFVTLKAAISLDGRIAASGGDSRWISGNESRKHAHRLRAQHHAIAVGAATVIADDPRLTVRHVRGVDPLIVVFDSRLSVVAASKRPAVLGPGTLVLHTKRASASAQQRLARSGAESVLVRADRDGHVSVSAALRTLGRRSIRSLLVEGGGRLHGAFVGASAWQRLFVYQAPRLLGDGVPWIGGMGVASVADAPHVRIVSRRKLGDDTLIVGEPVP